MLLRGLTKANGSGLSEIEYVGTYSKFLAPRRDRFPSHEQSNVDALDGGHRFQQDAKVR